MRGSLAYFHEELLKIRLISKGILVESGHLSYRNYFTALTQEIGNADVPSEGVEGVQVSLDSLVAAFLVELLEVLPVALEGSLKFSHI